MNELIYDKRYGCTDCKVVLDGHKVSYHACLELMDDDLREEICNNAHRIFDSKTDYSPQEFLEEYILKHKGKYKQNFSI